MNGQGGGNGMQARDRVGTCRNFQLIFFLSEADWITPKTKRKKSVFPFSVIFVCLLLRDHVMLVFLHSLSFGSTNAQHATDQNPYTTPQPIASPQMAPSRPPRPPPRQSHRDPKDLFKKRATDLIRKISDKDRYAIFLEPVDTKAVPDYLKVIPRPMDLSTVQANLVAGVYRTPPELRADLDLIWSNCCTFNADDSIFYKEAVRLRALCARHYDDMLRLLIRDGVAPALGLTSARSNPHRPPRITGKRPPRHRQLPTARPAFSASSFHSHDPTSPDPDPQPSPSMSASASHSAAQHSSFRDSQIRRARNAAEAAEAAASAAEVEARAAAIAAGIPPLSSTDGLQQHPPQIFAGPGGLLRDADVCTQGLPPRQYPVLNHDKMKDRCAEVPFAWRRVGRWRTGGATLSQFNTCERAKEVRCGRMYQKYVDKSAPVARRLLAIVLDPESVRQHDLNLLLQAGGRVQESVGNKVPEQNGWIGPKHKEATLEKNNIDGVETMTANGYHDMDKINGKTEHTEIESGGNEHSQERTGESPAKRARRGSHFDIKNRDSVPSKQVTTNTGKETAPSNSKKRDENSKQNRYPSKRAIHRLQMLLKEHNIDHTFLRGLVNSTSNIDSKKANAQGELGNANEVRSRYVDLERLLSSNHSTLMNVLRLRALRENADEADHEDLEDREREGAEELSKGVSMAVSVVAPKHVTHAVDVAECTIAMAQSIQSHEEKKE